MENIINDETIKECSKVLGNQVENKPQLDTSKISLVANVNPKMLRRTNIVKSSSAVNSASVTLYTTPTDRDFYLHTMALSVIKDVTSTSIRSTITGTPQGQAAAILLSIEGLTLTAQTGTQNITLAEPMLMARGTTITCTNTTNVANVSASASIYGYTVENNSAL